MTPARKAALQWFHDRGAIIAPLDRQGAPSATMIVFMYADDQLIHTPEGYTLTDKGRRDLHDAGR